MLLNLKWRVSTVVGGGELRLGSAGCLRRDEVSDSSPSPTCMHRPQSHALMTCCFRTIGALGHLGTRPHRA
eukprot:1928909-Amphidinium_carterae.1